MKEILKSIKIYIILTVLLGLIYPLVITGIAQITMPYQANGSLIKNDNLILGSKLIGQSFTDPKYFYSRPSAVDYNAAGSGASNLAPSSKKLMTQVMGRIKQVRTENNLKQDQKIPPDMVLTSASGLDPHISLENALIQADRVAKVRGISKDIVKKLINKILILIL